MKVRRLKPRRLFLEELETRLVPSTTSGLSYNWSGYAVQASTGAVSSVSGSWMVPTVTGTGTAYSSTWVGIDGTTSANPTVEQIGTEADISGGKAVYYAWYEMYPNPMVQLPMTVKPGDTITASVTYGGSGASSGFTLQIKDTTLGETYTSPLLSAPSAQRSSAEWIEEAPSSNSGILPLANFKTVSFSSAQAVINGITGSISAWPNESINMVSERGVTEATTGPLTSSGAGFSVTWNSNGTSSSGGGSSGGGGGGHGHGGGFGGFGGFGFREADQPAAVLNQSVQQAATLNQTTQQTAAAQQIAFAATVLNLPAQQTAATRTTTTQPIIASPSALGAPSSLPAFNSTLPALFSPPASSPGQSSVFGPFRASLNNPFASSFPSSGGNGGQEAPSSDGAVNPPPKANPDDVNPALELSDACFTEGGNALAAPLDASAAPDPTEKQVMAVEGAFDALFALALGGFVGIAVEKRDNRRRRLNLR